ncbi:MAG TPA: hypothetical protein DEV22_07105 [Collinsella sp.]|nr:hypothetical protein [Collinsella sp.]
MQPKHSAIVAGLTLALSFGAVAAPAPAAADEPTPGVASDATDIDKGLYTQQSFSGVLRSVQGVSFVNVTSEMKYFTKYESHGNYNQGFSYGDGYNALGYYQFDRRWSLIPFMKQVYNYNPAKYGMLKSAIDRGGDISNASNPMYSNGQLTELGRIAQEAFQGAYNADPAEFSALQDSYAYNSYYAVTEAWLKSALGIDISGRADCVKGMVWSITNMCGTYGCQDFFRWANLTNDMTDREFVTALSSSVVNNVARKYSSQPQYHEGWKNRYKNELKDCLVYITEDEAAATPPVEPEPEPEPVTPPPSQAPAAPVAPFGSSADTNGADGDTVDTPSNDAGASDGNGDVGSAGSAGSASPSNSADAAAGSGSSAGGSTAGSSDSSTNDKPSASEQLGSMFGSSLMVGINSGSSSEKDGSDQGATEKNEDAKGDSKDEGSKGSDSDKGTESDGEESKDSRLDEDGKHADGNGSNGLADDGADQNQGKTKVVTASATTTKSSKGSMPKTGDLILMASLASASLATLGATSIVSGKHKLDQQNKDAAEKDAQK